MRRRHNAAGRHQTRPGHVVIQPGGVVFEHELMTADSVTLVGSGRILTEAEAEAQKASTVERIPIRSFDPEELKREGDPE